MLTVLGALYSNLLPRRRPRDSDATEIRPLGSRPNQKQSCHFERNTDELRIGTTHAVLTTQDRFIPVISLFIWLVVFVLCWMYSDFPRMHLSCVRHPLESYSSYHLHEDCDCVLKGAWGRGKEHNFELSGVRLVEPARPYFDKLMRKNGAWFNKDTSNALGLRDNSSANVVQPDVRRQQTRDNSINSNVRRRLSSVSSNDDASLSNGNVGNEEVNVKLGIEVNSETPMRKRKPHAAAILRQAKAAKANRARSSVALSAAKQKQKQQITENQMSITYTYSYASGKASEDTKYAVQLQGGGEPRDIVHLGSFKYVDEAEAYRAEVQSFLERSYIERGLVRLELSVDPGRSVRVATIVCIILAISTYIVSWKQTTRMDARTDLVTIEVSTLCGLVTSRVVVPFDHVVRCVCVAKQAMTLRMQGRMNVSSQSNRVFRVYLETEEGEKLGLHMDQSMSDGGHGRALEQAVQDELRRLGSRKTPRGMQRPTASRNGNGFETSVCLRSRQQLSSNHRTFSMGISRSVVDMDSAVTHIHKSGDSSSTECECDEVGAISANNGPCGNDESTLSGACGNTLKHNESAEDVAIQSDVEVSCVVCLTRPPQVALLPCRHVCTCTKCAEKIDDCPVCREEIQDRMALYIV